MKVRFISPKSPGQVSQSMREIESIFDSVWKTSSLAFEASNVARVAMGMKPAMGMQASLNSSLDHEFSLNGWHGQEGRYFKETTWVRISFRHQMSLGADFFDALKQSKIEGFDEVILIYGTKAFLKTISPGDGGSLCSFERAELFLSDLETIAPDFGIHLGRLSS